MSNDRQQSRTPHKEWSGFFAIMCIVWSLGMVSSAYLHGIDWLLFGIAALMPAGLGMMLMLPGIRLLQFEKPPLEKWMEADDDF